MICPFVLVCIYREKEKEKEKKKERKMEMYLLLADSATAKYCRMFRCFLTLQQPFKQFGQGAKISFESRSFEPAPPNRRVSFEGPSRGPKYWPSNTAPPAESSPRSDEGSKSQPNQQSML
jgi:hypothetical protein